VTSETLGTKAAMHKRNKDVYDTEITKRKSPIEMIICTRIRYSFF